MGLTMIFNYVLLGLALFFILLTKSDDKDVEHCHVEQHPHHHEEALEMDSLNKEKETNKVE